MSPTQLSDLVCRSYMAAGGHLGFWSFVLFSRTTKSLLIVTSWRFYRFVFTDFFDQLNSFAALSSITPIIAHAILFFCYCQYPLHMVLPSRLPAGFSPHVLALTSLFSLHLVLNPNSLTAHSTSRPLLSGINYSACLPPLPQQTPVMAYSLSPVTNSWLSSKHTSSKIPILYRQSTVFQTPSLPLQPLLPFVRFLVDGGCSSDAVSAKSRSISFHALT